MKIKTRSQLSVHWSQQPFSRLNVEAAVRRRYSDAARQRQATLCCPISYNRELLKIIPREIIERDYGCGDPSAHLRPGETVLDLGSGAGKICYIAAQVVGPRGRVIGVDMNDDMLALARKYRGEIARELGCANVEFRKGKIQDLRLDYERFERWLAKHPVRDANGWLAAQAQAERLRATKPMITDASVDVVVSNCVLNLVAPQEKPPLFAEIFRVLRRGGRAVISDIVSDKDVPPAMQRDPRLWSGCVSGALREDLFLKAFENAGFYGARLLARGDAPWRMVRGIEFRSVTVEAFKGKEGPCLDRNQAVIYKGPFKEVADDDGHRLRRGVREAVCDKTFQIYTREPYATHFFAVPPRNEVPFAKAKPFACHRQSPRHPRETKGSHYSATSRNGNNGNGTCGSACC